MYYIFFVHLSVDGHLGCFHILAIVNSTTINIGGACIFLNYNFVWICAQEWDCWIIRYLFLVFWETSVLFSMLAAPIYIPTHSLGGFPFLHTLSNICYL